MLYDCRQVKDTGISFLHGLIRKLNKTDDSGTVRSNKDRQKGGRRKTNGATADHISTTVMSAALKSPVRVFYQCLRLGMTGIEDALSR